MRILGLKSTCGHVAIKHTLHTALKEFETWGLEFLLTSGGSDVTPGIFNEYDDSAAGGGETCVCVHVLDVWKCSVLDIQ